MGIGYDQIAGNGRELVIGSGVIVINGSEPGQFLDTNRASAQFSIYSTS